MTSQIIIEEEAEKKKDQQKTMQYTDKNATSVP